MQTIQATENLPRKTSHGKILGRNRNAMRKLILARDAEDIALDRKIGSICRGC